MKKQINVLMYQNVVSALLPITQPCNLYAKQKHPECKKSARPIISIIVNRYVQPKKHIFTTMIGFVTWPPFLHHHYYKGGQVTKPIIVVKICFKLRIVCHSST